ncbi:UNVERIFIED_ORG: hypothetical protein ABRZ91_003749 [Heyndrickxia coagulans]
MEMPVIAAFLSLFFLRGNAPIIRTETFLPGPHIHEAGRVMDIETDSKYGQL